MTLHQMCVSLTLCLLRRNSIQPHYKITRVNTISPVIKLLYCATNKYNITINPCFLYNSQTDRYLLPSQVQFT